MADDTRTPILIEGHGIGTVQLASLTDPNRRETNLSLGIVQLPRLLEDFRPPRAMLPQERYLLIVRAFCTAMNGGARNQLDESELAKRYTLAYGARAFLHHQVRRASGGATCVECQRPFQSHKLDWSILDQNNEPFVNRLCNGDLVKL